MPSYFERTGKKPPEYMKRRGKSLAAANKSCQGTHNKNGEFYRCLKRKLAKKK